MKLVCIKDAYDDRTGDYRIFTKDKEYGAIETGDYIVIPADDNLDRNRITSAAFIVKHFILSQAESVWQKDRQKALRHGDN